MYQSHGRISAQLAVALSMMTGAACADRTAPTDPAIAAPNAAVEPTAKPVQPSKTPMIDQLVPLTTTLVIGGASGTFDLVVSNPGSAQKNVVLEGEVVQGGARRLAGVVPADCGAGLGVVPTGICTMQLAATASNVAAGSGTLVPGAAEYVLTMYQTYGSNKQRKFDSELVGIMLEAPELSITSIDLATTTFVIDGDQVSYTATLQNTGPAISLIVLQAEMIQGETRRGANGTNAACADQPSGTLPTGGCSFQFTAAASNTAGGSGTLVPGSADLLFTLYYFDGVNTTPVDALTIPVTLVNPGVTVTSLELEATTLVIGGARVGFTATVFNSGPSVSTIAFQGEIVQGGNRSPAGGLSASCGAGTGVLPTGTCNFGFTAGASNELSFPSPLVAGPAEFVLSVVHTSNGNAVLATRSVPVTLTN